MAPLHFCPTRLFRGETRVVVAHGAARAQATRLNRCVRSRSNRYENNGSMTRPSRTKVIGRPVSVWNSML